MKRGRYIFLVAVLLIAAAVAVIYAVRYFKLGEKAASGQPQQGEGRTKAEAAISRGSFERRAVNEFANALREVFEWRKQQRPNSPASRASLVKTLAQKFQSLPTANLPKEFANSWAGVLETWKELAKAEPPSPALIERGKKAAEQMNKMLRASGYGDLML